jgi:hypothetical protein
MKLSPLLQGTWPVIVTPTAFLFLVIAAEQLRLPAWLAFALGTALSLGGFAYFIRTQFARRKQDADIRRSWPLAIALSFLLLGAVLLAFGLYGRSGVKVASGYSHPSTLVFAEYHVLCHREMRPNQPVNLTRNGMRQSAAEVSSAHSSSPAACHTPLRSGYRQR